jgi:phospholipid/cholesterol/gamma-HCH transport system substrate-binding protein
VAWRNGATLAKKQASLLGDYYLELTPGLEGPRLVDGAEIHNVIRTVGTDTIFEQMDSIAGHLEAIAVDVRSVTRNLSEVFGDEEGLRQLERIVDEVEAAVTTVSAITQENRGGIARIVQNAEDITVEVRGASQEARVMVHELRGDIDRIARQVEGMTGELRTLVQVSGQDVQQGLASARATVGRLEVAAESLVSALDNVDTISERIVQGEGTIGRLVNDPGIADQTELLLRGANSFVQPLARLQTWVEMRSEYGLPGQSLKNYLTLSFRPDRDKFYIFELVDDPRGRTDIIRTATLQNDPDRPAAVFEETVRTTDAFRVSVMLGHRWPVFRDRGLLVGGRWGIIESTGGLGLDVWTVGESLQFRADAFDFVAEQNPRIRLVGALQLDAFRRGVPWLRNLFVQAGWDDVFNQSRRVAFVGGGIRFNDLDLKTLLIAAPTPTF